MTIIFCSELLICESTAVRFKPFKKYSLEKCWVVSVVVPLFNAVPVSVDFIAHRKHKILLVVVSIIAANLALLIVIIILILVILLIILVGLIKVHQSSDFANATFRIRGQVSSQGIIVAPIGIYDNCNNACDSRALGDSIKRTQRTR